MQVESYFSKIPQSVLISGRDLDKLSEFLRKWSAKLLNCAYEDVEKYPDFYIIYPTNKMRQINVDTLREFNRNVYISSQQGGHKVFVIYEADRMNGAASNALLKTLEEPARDTSIFLLTSRPYDLLPTLRSRCWWIQMNPFLGEELDEKLKQWLSDLKDCVRSCWETKAAISPLKIYGFLYRLQALVLEKTESTKIEDETLSEEELSAKKASIEKQYFQFIFQSIEQMLSELVREINKSVYYENFPLWIDSLEKSFRRIEVNFGIIPALEAFLLNFCKPLSL